MSSWIAGIIAKLMEILGQDLMSYFKSLWSKWTRSQNQAAAAKTAAADQGKPRDDKTKTDEANDINS